VRPGITGPATLKYRNEEELLESVAVPEDYNNEVIFPDKIRLNREYVENWSFGRDIHYIWATISGRSDA
jgi:lipopolysaccharide/colanic/teichoic acid biosynthesis glycosyltransferase